MTTELPPRADLSQLRGQAKDLRRAVVGRNPAALKRIEALGRRPEDFTLRDAQLIVARESRPGAPSSTLKTMLSQVGV